MADFDQAIELIPNYAVPFVNRRLARQMQGDSIRTAADFERCIAR
jgi:hypothetical protein